jgi:hypothetical protein
MTAVARWLLSGVGAGAALAAAVLGPALVVMVGVLVGLPVLLITTLALVAVYFAGSGPARGGGESPRPAAERTTPTGIHDSLSAAATRKPSTRHVTILHPCAGSRPAPHRLCGPPCAPLGSVTRS